MTSKRWHLVLITLIITSVSSKANAISGMARNFDNDRKPMQNKWLFAE